MRFQLAVLAGAIACAAAAQCAAEDIRVVRPDRAYDFPAVGYDSPVVVTALAVSPTGDRIAASGDDHHIRLWDLKSGAKPRLLKGHEDWVRCLRFDNQGARLASVGDDRGLRVWRASDAEIEINKQAASGPIGTVCFLPGGDQLLTASYGEKVRLFSLSSGALIKQYACPCQDTRVLAVSRDGKRMAAAGRNGVVRVWDLATGQAGKDIPADGRRIHSLAFSPDGKYLATGGAGAKVRLWETQTADLVSELPVRPAKVRALHYLDEKRLAVGGTDNQIQIWDTTRKTRTHRLLGHTGTVAVLALSSDGRTLASAGFDTNIMIWRVPPQDAPATAKAGGATVR